MSNLQNMTDDELLRQIDDLRAYSPIIDELAKRLDSVIKYGKGVKQECDHESVCPVCKSKVVINIDLDREGGVELVGISPVLNKG